MTRVLATALAVLFTCAVASAQPGADPIVVPARPDPIPSNGNTEMPIAGPRGTEVLSAEGSGASTSSAAVALEQPIDPDKYICGPGDTFELNFWGQQNFRLRIAIDLEGRTFISKVGFVAVSGKSLSAVRADVKKRVRSTYPGLQFDLTLISPRQFLVHVVDNVKAPGAHTASPLDRVSNVLARVGAAGSRRRIEIRRKNGQQLTADLVMYELTGKTDYNPHVLDGDVISVPHADLVVSISGAIRRPGRYELIRTKDLGELLDLAGGFSNTVARTLPIKIVRRSNQLDTYIDLHFADDRSPNAPLRDYDRVIVRSTDELQRSVLLIGAVVGASAVDKATASRYLPFIDGDTVLSLIDRAGGILAPGDLKRSYISRPTKDGKPTIIPVDLEALFVRRDFSVDKPIRMNDTIVVPPLQHGILVEGAVARSGLYNYNPQFGISEYLGQAGGRTRSAKDIEDVRIIDRDGRMRSYAPSLRPNPGDAIMVPERAFTRAETVQLVFAGAGLIISAVAITLAATR